MTLLLALWAALIAGFDLRRRRVPNVLLVLVLVPALLALIVNGQGLLGVGVLDSLIGAALGLALMLPGYVLGKLGAGDAKFTAVIGLLIGFDAMLVFLLAAGLALGVLAGADWMARRQMQRRIAAAPALALAFAAGLAGLLPAL